MSILKLILFLYNLLHNVIAYGNFKTIYISNTISIIIDAKLYIYKDMLILMILVTTVTILPWYYIPNTFLRQYFNEIVEQIHILC